MISNDNPVHSEHDFSVTVYYELYRGCTKFIEKVVKLINYCYTFSI